MEITKLLVKLFARQKKVTMCWVPAHVNVRGNEGADAKSREAANSCMIITKPQLPYKDYFPIIKSKLKEAWAEEWTMVEGNKLRSIKDSVQPWPSSQRRSRKEEVLLSRLCIGHTHLTHHHLMEGRPAPYCEDCLVPTSVMHVLAECPSLSDIRQRLYPNTVLDYRPARPIVQTTTPISYKYS